MHKFCEPFKLPSTLLCLCADLTILSVPTPSLRLLFQLRNRRIHQPFTRLPDTHEHNQVSVRHVHGRFVPVRPKRALVAIERLHGRDPLHPFHVFLEITIVLRAILAHLEPAFMEQNRVDAAELFLNAVVVGADHLVDDHAGEIAAHHWAFVEHVQHGLEPERMRCLVNDCVAPLQSAVDRLEWIGLGLGKVVGPSDCINVPHAESERAAVRQELRILDQRPKRFAKRGLVHSRWEG